MFKIIGKLLGMEYKKVKYDREVLNFMIVGAAIFLFLGISHTENGAKFLYTNKLIIAVMSEAEDEGIRGKTAEELLLDFKEAIPVNIREYELYDIKDRLENYIYKLKGEKSGSLDSIIYSIENIMNTENKEALLSKLKELDLEGMLIEAKKEEIVKQSLQNAAEWQTNFFLSNVYIALGGLLAFSSIIVKVVFDITLIEKKSKKIKKKEQIL